MKMIEIRGNASLIVPSGTYLQVLFSASVTPEKRFSVNLTAVAASYARHDRF